MKNNSKLAFLGSTRFWAIVIAAVAIYAETKLWIGEPEMILISTILGGFVTVRTIDRATEQKILAAGVSSGQLNAEDVTKVPPTK